MSFWNEKFLGSIKTEMFTVAESYSIVIGSPLVNAENHKLQETLRQFYETLICQMFFKCVEMS